MLSFRLICRKTLKGESSWRTGAGGYKAVENRLARADKFDFDSLWKHARAANDKRVDPEQESLARRTAIAAVSESQHRLKRALRLGCMAKYGKAV